MDDDDYFERIDDAIARGFADRREVDELRFAAALRRLEDFSLTLLRSSAHTPTKEGF